MNTYLLSSRSVNSFLRKTLIFVATSHQIHYFTSAGQQEG